MKDMYIYIVYTNYYALYINYIMLFYKLCIIYIYIRNFKSFITKTQR